MPRTEVVPVRLPIADAEKLRQQAKAENVTVSDLVRRLLLGPKKPILPEPAPGCAACLAHIEDKRRVVAECRELLAEVPPPDWRDSYWEQRVANAMASWHSLPGMRRR
jgi:hypothetical protein